MKFASLILITSLIALPMVSFANSANDQQSLDQSLTHLKAGNTEAARGVLADMLKDDPDNFEAQVRLGGLELSIGRYEEAIEHLKRAAGLDAQSPRPFIGLSLAYMHIGRGTLAMAATEEAIRRDPSKKAALQPLLDRFAKNGTINNGPIMGH